MTSIYKVQVKHLNEHSTLYGGQLLEWIDNYSLAKTEKYKKHRKDQFVTRSMNCEFIYPVHLGDLIKLRLVNEKIGNTSLTFELEVVSNKKVVAKGNTTFVKMHNNKKSKIMVGEKNENCNNMSR
jgi:acyl-CoA hydrolase